MLLVFNTPGQFPDSLIREVTKSIPADPDRLRDLLKKWLRLFKTTPQRLVQGFFLQYDLYPHTSRACHSLPITFIPNRIHGSWDPRRQRTGINSLPSGCIV